MQTNATFETNSHWQIGVLEYTQCGNKLIPCEQSYGVGKLIMLYWRRTLSLDKCYLQNKLTQANWCTGNTLIVETNS